MGFFDWLFGDDDPQPQTYTSTQTTDIPSWIEEPSKRLIGTAEQLVSQPYQPYGYSRLEPFSQQTLDAMNNSTAMSGIGAYKTGLGYNQALASGRSALSDINSYINPYTQQVAGIAADELRRQHGVQTQSDRAQAVASGAFGGSRQGVVQAERERNLGQNIANVYATANNQAFTQGLDAILRERENLRNAGVAVGSLAAQGQNLGYPKLR